MTKLIEPRLATAVARRFAGDRGRQGSYLVDRLTRDLEVCVPRSEELVAEASGIPPPAPVRWAVIDRGTWAETNIHSMTTMLSPIADKVAAQLQSSPLPMRLAQQAVVSTEVGVLLGYVSRRVLGQYDLLVPEPEPQKYPRRRKRGTNGAALLFVGTNMVETEQRFGFIPEEFTLWVAVHEVTHRFQFEGVPWLRPKFLGLVREYLESVELGPKTLTERLKTATRRLMSRSTPPEEKNPAYLFSTDEQRVLLDQIQALMAVVEGHGNYVMDSVGAEVIPSFKRMRHVFEGRRQQQRLVQRVLSQVLGLEMKMRQYELGQRFCEAVVEREGDAALRRLWDDQSQLPSMTELRDPQLWLRRVA
jgi:coenzyme F420 biosynthesis associated uncharacterized protein